MTVPPDSSVVALLRTNPVPTIFSPFSKSKTLTARPAAEFTLGIQSSPTHLASWRSVFDSLSPAVRKTFAVFVYCYGGGDADQAAATSFLTEWASEPDSVLVLAATPATRRYKPDTWTTGRNALASAMYAYELARGRQFGWWGFADGDMYDLYCAGHEVPTDRMRAAECLSLVLSAAKGSPFALVATVGYGDYTNIAFEASENTFLSPNPRYHTDGNLIVRVLRVSACAALVSST